MSVLRTHRSVGIIPSRAGAAVAALKARAAAWEVPLIENPERLSLFVWGCELRLTPEDDTVRIDLMAPEARLIGTLQDSATELFEAEGLSVKWDRVNEGALAPGLSLMQVVSVTPRTPGFVRVRLQGPEAARFGETSLHFRLLLPQPGRAPVWPRIAANGRTTWPEGPDALHRPVYTVIGQQDDWLDFDIFRHKGSPTCDWADNDPIGQQVGIIGPGGGWCPDAETLWLFGDETALPAIIRMLDLAKYEVRACIRASTADLAGLLDDPRVRQCDDLLAAQAAVLPGKGVYVWFAAQAEEARAARRSLTERGFDRRDFTAVAYWS